MKKILFALCAAICCQCALATEYSFGQGKLVVKKLAANAVRIQYVEQAPAEALPEWLYVKDQEVKSNDISVRVDAAKQQVEVLDKSGKVVFTATAHQLKSNTVAGLQTYEARLAFTSPEGEFLYGLGQFQDGYTNVRGLSRRLTQVNTQISIPMMLSSRGYGILWNNYGLTDFNPMDNQVALEKRASAGNKEVVNVTTTEGGRQEVRERNRYEATIEVAEDGDYSLLLDVGQQMARRHNLVIDGKPVIELQNMWLPPTASTIVHLSKGSHTFTAELSNGDKPVVYYGKVKNETVFRSPVAQAVDYTVFVGSADEVIAAYRKLTGDSPLMPQWALGYIHCRERFHSQEEILTTAKRFRSENLPADVMVQDWQYWGKYGWNAMRFDEANYPDPKQLTDELHAMNMRLMVSVWSKIDKNSEVGKQMLREGYYIPGTDWIDFFNPAAANAYWKNFSKRLVPLGIDAWWQDATEPENDDLVGRRVVDGKYPGELFRNVYPLMVNKTVYEGLRQDDPAKRPMILTRCGFPGIQRYGSAMWSGDVGNDWETLRRQITAGLGMQAAGIPWWTYDAGGFFRPGNQYQDAAYIERMLRWIEISVYLPLMRVHGYMSNTEPWNYGSEAQSIIGDCLKERYRLLPYIYSNAAAIAFDGSTLMRPLIFDFANDPEALAQKYEYMFGKSLLVNPITESNVNTWRTYLPVNKAGWYDFRTGQYYAGGQNVETSVNRTHIPVYVKGGSILPIGPDKQYAADKADAPIELHIYPGADATFTLYEDDGKSNDYEQGKCSRITFTWNDASQTLTIDKRKGAFEGMPASRTFIVVKDGKQQNVTYQGKKINIH
jgi:alpha-D-xyloside xylohydrolase